VFVLASDLSSWYAGRSVLVLLGFACLAGYGLYASLGGRSMFSDKLLGLQNRKA